SRRRPRARAPDPTAPGAAPRRTPALRAVASRPRAGLPASPAPWPPPPGPAAATAGAPRRAGAPPRRPDDGEAGRASGAASRPSARASAEEAYPTAGAAAGTPPRHPRTLARPGPPEGRSTDDRCTHLDSAPPGGRAPGRRTERGAGGRGDDSGDQSGDRRDLLPGSGGGGSRRGPGGAGRSTRLRVRALAADESRCPGEADPQAGRGAVGAPGGVRSGRLPGERQDLSRGHPRRRRAGERHAGLRLGVAEQD